MSDVLKVSHHGSDDDGLSALLGRIEPAIAIISAGRENRFGHPHPETLAALEASGATVYRTDLHGDVTVESDDGRAVAVTTEHGP